MKNVLVEYAHNTGFLAGHLMNREGQHHCLDRLQFFARQSASRKRPAGFQNRQALYRANKNRSRRFYHGSVPARIPGTGNRRKYAGRGGAVVNPSDYRKSGGVPEAVAILAQR